MNKYPLICSSPLVRVLAACLLLLFVCPSWGQNAGKDSVPGKIVAVIPPDAPPTYFRDSRTGMPSGFAVEIMDKVAERSGFQVRYVFEDGWSDIIKKIEHGGADVSPGMGISDERKKVLAFSEPIDTFPVSFFVRSGSHGIHEGAGALTVGVIKGSFAFEKLKDQKNLNLRDYEGFPAGLFDLLAGKIDAFAAPAPTMLHLAVESGVQDRIMISGPPIAEIRRGIAVRKENAAMLERLNSALDGFVGSPEYKAIYVRWYGRPVTYWTAGRIAAYGALLILAVIVLMLVWRHVSILRLNRELTKSIADRTRAEESLKLDEDRLKTLLELSQMQFASEKELTDYALEQAVRLSRSYGGYLHFFDEDQQTLHLYSWSQNVMKTCTAAPAHHYPLDAAGVWADSVRKRSAVIHNDYQALPEKKGYPEGHFLLRRHLGMPIFDDGRIVGVIGVGNKDEPYDESDIRQTALFMTSMWRILKQRRLDDERERLILELREALNKVRTLSGLLPICASCKKIRNDKGYWEQIEVYIRNHSGADFSHGICPECAKQMYPDFYREK